MPVLAGAIEPGTKRVIEQARAFADLGADVLVVCTLDHPDSKLVSLVLVAETARDLGARSVTLVAPYLGYMRQDARFHPGEGVTSLYVGRLLSSVFDRLVTIDPHLHRHVALWEVYSIPHVTASAAASEADT